MKKEKLDEKYNIIEEKIDYQDDLIDSVEAINKACLDNLISKKEASLLFNIVLKREFKREAKKLLPLNNKHQEVHSLFMNFKAKQIRHA